jgi:histidine ammonia-lyase
MISIDGRKLSLSEVVAVARFGEKVQLNPNARERMQQSHAWLQDIIEAGKPVYGINTGFGVFSEKRISIEDATDLSRNLILSHAMGTGPDLSTEAVRAAMLIRANTLSSGFSGVRPVVVDTMLEMLNYWVTPVIPSQGSLGSSGDLAPLSHLALVFTTDNSDRDEDSGQADFGKEQVMRLSGKAAMNQAGIPRLILGPKEGLALSNGATFSAALMALALYDAANLLDTADISLAMSLEALLGVSSAFDSRLHATRGHPGQVTVAKNIRRLTSGSTFLDSQRHIQDAYSLRCAPQVHGTARDTLINIQDTIQREINAATDNPLIFGPGEVISGGNFHGEPVGFAADFLSIALSEIAAISERRIFRLTDGNLNANLPPMLVDPDETAGLNSGLMMAQYTAASLVLENQSLASPDSVFSLPTSGEQEDHNANSMTAARHTCQIIVNLTHILAIELYCAARALDLRMRFMPSHRMGKGVSAAYNLIRKDIPYKPGDILWAPEIEFVHHILQNGAFSKEVWEAID